jgi:hypothetical protein
MKRVILYSFLTFISLTIIYFIGSPFFKKQLDSNLSTSSTKQSSTATQKYLSDIKLFENPKVNKRLKKMLKNDYDSFVENFEVQTPIKEKNGFIFSEGFKSHSGESLGSAIAIDTSFTILYVGIFEHGKLKNYSNSKNDVPDLFIEWINARQNLD